MRLFEGFMGSKRIIVSAPRHSYRHTPMRIPLDDFRKTPSALKDAGTGHLYGAQVIEESGRAYLCWILDELRKGETREFQAVTEPVTHAPGVELIESARGAIDIKVGGSLFTSYHYGSDLARPFLYPVTGPGGVCVTRHYPMVQDVPGETKDHPHHKSVWIAHGDVNGVDNWSKLDGHGKTLHRQLAEQTSGPVFGRITTLNDWVSSDGRKVMEEERTITVYNLPETHRFIDLRMVFRATEGDVKFGDTKEGGIISVRVATSMDGKKGGLITNSFGGVTEAESWGKRAHWCDYSGPVDGSTVGITIFDHPTNFRYPAYWHVRDYGLMTANPFALSAYYNDPERDGSHTVRTGSDFPFTYRLFVHEGDAVQSDVAETYHAFVNPPSAEIR